MTSSTRSPEMNGRLTIRRPWDVSYRQMPGSVLTSIPAVGVRTTERVVTDVVGKKFTTAGHLA